MVSICGHDALSETSRTLWTTVGRRPRALICGSTPESSGRVHMYRMLRFANGCILARDDSSDMGLIWDATVK